MFGNESTCLFLGIFANVAKLSDPFIKWRISRRGWYRGVGMTRYGLDYWVHTPVGVMLCGIDGLLYKVVCC